MTLRRKQFEAGPNAQSGPDQSDLREPGTRRGLRTGLLATTAVAVVVLAGCSSADTEPQQDQGPGTSIDQNPVPIDQADPDKAEQPVDQVDSDDSDQQDEPHEPDEPDEPVEKVTLDPELLRSGNTEITPFPGLDINTLTADDITQYIEGEEGENGPGIGLYDYFRDVSNVTWANSELSPEQLDELLRTIPIDSFTDSPDSEIATKARETVSTEMLRIKHVAEAKGYAVDPDAINNPESAKVVKDPAIELISSNADVAYILQGQKPEDGRTSYGGTLDSEMDIFLVFKIDGELYDPSDAGATEYLRDTDIVLDTYPESTPLIHLDGVGLELNDANNLLFVNQ